MTMPLERLRVVDWTIWQQGPACSAMLGDLGAEGIKIEERVGGDPGRGVLSMAGLDMTKVPNSYFEGNNRNKLSITLDLKKPEAKEIVYKLVAKSDIFVQNFRKGVADRLGLGYDDLRRHNDKLIYATASGYGPEGPDSGEPSFDLLGQARSGHTGYLEAVFSALSKDEPLPTTLVDARRNLAIIEAARQASETHRAVDVTTL